MRHRLSTFARPIAALGALAAIAACADRATTAPDPGRPSLLNGAYPDISCAVSPASATIARG
ncbi:MAG TPA: hypothetical protein VFS44_15675, partial [Gemmatimonadaceae bacterium]|nr:hypothetical protein [Gemmatimonadaceae bacterium]